MDQNFGVSWSGGAAPAISLKPTLTGDTEIGSTFTLGAGTVTDQEMQFGFDKDNIKGILITVEDNDLATVTMETNASDHAGGQIFVFPIGGGELYFTNRAPTSGGSSMNPISTDVATTFWTKTGADTPTVKIRVLFNA